MHTQKAGSDNIDQGAVHNAAHEKQGVVQANRHCHPNAPQTPPNTGQRPFSAGAATLRVRACARVCKRARVCSVSVRLASSRLRPYYAGTLCVCVCVWVGVRIWCVSAHLESLRFHAFL